VPYGTREWGPILTKIRAIKPAWIHLEIVSSPDLITFFHQFMKAPTHSLINFGYGLTLPDFLPNLGQEANGLIGQTITIPDPAPTPESEAWVKEFQNRYNAPPAAGSFAVYTGVMIWAEAVKKVGKVDDYAAINDYVANHKFRTLEGREVWFDKDHKIPNTVWPVNWVQIQDGKMRTLFLTGKELKEMVPYKDFKFQTPPWIKK
jgi:ABC-type branched-subunit amino acid transport system substrate-binding protein